jgi:hypothetical protein
MDELPVDFTLQHTVDRGIMIKNLKKETQAKFPEDVRANEIKIPLGYARLYNEKTDASRQWFMSAGLSSFLEILDTFYSLDANFVDGKGKFSTGSQLLKAKKKLKKKQV